MSLLIFYSICALNCKYEWKYLPYRKRSKRSEAEKPSLTEFMTQLINNQRANGYIKSLTWRVWDYLYVRQSVHFSACVFVTHSHSMFGEIAGVSAPVSASTPVKLIHFRAPWHHSRFCSCMQAERAARPLAHHRVVGRVEREKYEHFSYKKGQQHPIKTRRASKSEEKTG